ncbi:MAG: helix-turn-helix transcriptional regulator [Pseudorhodobacter sp.]|nr:helix-turn-helix transcriptional regulator [Pseudorhodobacter sp.]
MLAARRRETGFSQAALAKRAGCSRPTIIALERDLSGSVSILLTVLAVLGLRRHLRGLNMRSAGGLILATNSPARDLVMTPAPLAAAVFAHSSERIACGILDPAGGKGAFFDQFPPHIWNGIGAK